MDNFLENWASTVLDALLAQEEGPPTSYRCPCMRSDSALPGSHAASPSSLFRCLDCYGVSFQCQSCVVNAHAQNPFHRVHRWDPVKRYLEKLPLLELGLQINLGHGGKPCPSTVTSGRLMTVVHDHGVHPCKILFCACVSPTLFGTMPDAAQLLHFGLFPGSWSVPSTVYTLHVLRDFHLLSLQSKLNSYDYVQYLCRTTDNTFSSEVKDRYHEFMTAMREFSFIRALKRNGLRPSKELPPGSLAVLCPSCPQIGINMDPNWQKRTEKFA